MHLVPGLDTICSACIVFAYQDEMREHRYCSQVKGRDRNGSPFQAPHAVAYAASMYSTQRYMEAHKVY